MRAKKSHFIAYSVMLTHSRLYTVVNSLCFLSYYALLAVFASINLSLNLLSVGMTRCQAYTGALIGTASALVNELIDMQIGCNPQSMGKAEACKSTFFAIGSIVALAGYDVYNRHRNMLLVQIRSMSDQGIIQNADSYVLSAYQRGMVVLATTAMCLTYVKNMVVYYAKNHKFPQKTAQKTAAIGSKMLLAYLASPYLCAVGVSAGAVLYGIGDSATMYGILSLLHSRGVLACPAAARQCLSLSYFLLSVLQRLSLWGVNFEKYLEQTNSRLASSYPCVRILRTTAAFRQYLAWSRRLATCFLNITGTLLHHRGIKAAILCTSSLAYLRAEQIQTDLQLDMGQKSTTKGRQNAHTQTLFCRFK